MASGGGGPVRDRRAGRVPMVGRRAQGWYYLLGGLWWLVHPRSFAAVAGPKPDRFQTDVTAGLFTAAGAALLVGATSVPPAAVRVLGAGCGLACLVVDLRHRPDIRPVFLADAALNAAFAACWAPP